MNIQFIIQLMCASSSHQLEKEPHHITSIKQPNSTMPRQKKYTPEDLAFSISAIRKGEITAKEATETFDIPKSTISNKINGIHSRKEGRPCALDPSAETRLSVFLKFLVIWRLPLDMGTFVQVVAELLNKLNIVEPRFVDNIPGEKWVRGFLKRNDCASTIPEHLKPARANVT